MALRTNRDLLVPMVLVGEVTHPELPWDPFLVSAAGEAYIPLGAGGVLYGYGPGSPAFAPGDHAEPGATLAAPGERQNQALLGYACLGNPATAQAGGRSLRGFVCGLRGEGRGVLASFADEDLEQIHPGCRVAVRCLGTGLRLLDHPEVSLHHLSPGLLTALLAEDRGGLVAKVRAEIPSYLLGNGVGRPAATWEVDLVSDDRALMGELGLQGLRIGDVVALPDWEAVTLQGYAPGALTIGVVVHGDSPLPGHGPGILPLASTQRDGVLRAVRDPARPILFT